jgi:hypothetical protein
MIKGEQCHALGRESAALTAGFVGYMQKYFEVSNARPE